MQTLHVQQRCVPPPFDIHRSIDVGVVRVTTTDAGEARLALAAPGIYDTAGGAGLARKASRNGYDLTAPFFHLVGKDRRELVPARVENAAIEPGLLANVLARSGNCAFRTRSHGESIQVFQHRHAKALRDVERGSVVEVASDASLPSLEAGDASLGPTPAVRSALASSGHALCLTLADLNPLQARGHREDVARREREGSRNATINADNIAVRRRGLVFDFASKRDVPAIRVRRNSNVFNYPTHWAGVSKLNPPDLRQTHSRPLRVQDLRPNFASVESECIIEPPLPWARISCSPSKEILKGAVKISQRLLLAGDVDGLYPIKFGAQTGQLDTLRCEPNFVPSTLNDTLLQRYIVDQSGYARKMTEQNLLPFTWFQPVSEAAQNHSVNIQADPVLRYSNDAAREDRMRTVREAGHGE